MTNYICSLPFNELRKINSRST